MEGLQAKIIQVPREENKHADRLSKAASADPMATIDEVLSFTQSSPLIDAVCIQEIGSEND